MMQRVADWLRAWRWELVLAAMLVVLYAGFHDLYGLFDVDEAVFTQASREMLDGGPYAMPTYNEVPRYQKPPLIYWIQIGFMQVLGADSLWAARLPSALFALATIGLLWGAVWRLTGNRVWALAAAAALGLNLSFVVVGRAATADAVLNFFMLALVAWCLEVLYRKKPLPYAWVGTGVLVALGLLAKGPVAGVPAALVVVPLLAARADRWALWQRLAPLKVVGVAGVCLLPWLWLLHAEGMLWGFFNQFIMDENLKRFGPGLTNTQGGSPLFYLLVLMFGFMPWVFVLPAAIARARADWLGKLQSKNITVALPYLALVWACGVVGLFMMSGTKLAHYIVPAYPALALLVGAWVADKKPLRAWGVELWAVAQALLVVVVLLLVPVLLLGLREEPLRGVVGVVQQMLGFAWPPRDVLAYEVLRLPVDIALWPFVVMAVGMVGATLAYALPARTMVLGMAGGVWVFLMGAVVGVVPMVWAYTQAPLMQLAREVALAGPHVRIVHLGLHKPSVLWFSQRPFAKLEKPFQLPAHMQAGEQVLILTDQTEVAGIGAEMGRIALVEVKQCVGGYCLVGVVRGP